MGLLAGLIGLLLVVVYSLFQYRALGFVTVASLVVAGRADVSWPSPSSAGPKTTGFPSPASPA